MSRDLFGESFTGDESHLLAWHGLGTLGGTTRHLPACACPMAHALVIGGVQSDVVVSSQASVLTALRDCLIGVFGDY